MLKGRKLLKINLLVSIILVFGFIITSFLSYNANYRTSLSNVEQVSSLTAESIYYQLTTMFTRPVNISLTMSRDTLLVTQLNEETKQMNNEEYISTLKNYLETYRGKYNFDSVFLVSEATKRYYNFNGVDRVLTEDNPENVWYYDLMKSGQEYSLNVDNDEVDGADNAITVFVNCKIYGENNKVLGVVGVGIRISYLKDFLKTYEEKYHLRTCLVNEDGIIEISTTHTGYGRTDWFSEYGRESIRSQVLDWKSDKSNLEFWTENEDNSQEKSFVASRYIPELSWHLVVEQDTGSIIGQMKIRLYLTAVIIIGIIIIVLIIISLVLFKFIKQISELMEERQAIFKKATEELYDNIYELNITKNGYANAPTKQYFESLGAKGLPYNKALKVVAEKQIKKEYREGYISTFSPENVIKEFESGNNHLSYDFLITQNDMDYFWMRIDAYIFLSQEDNCIHMFTYRKNIDAEKQIERRASTDEMTGFLTKTATEHSIMSELSEKPEDLYAFFIFDIDNFKQANDQFGHSFGDYCLKEFTEVIRNHFRDGDILGRIGGDEFVAVIPIPDTRWVESKARELSAALNFNCVREEKEWKLSSSIGVSIAPEDGNDFKTLYEKADAALYRTKQRGKNGYTIY